MYINLPHRIAQAAAAVALAFSPLLASAQETVVTTTTGTISSLTPTEVVVTRSAGGPVTYRYTKRTTFVDSDGRTVTYESIRPGDSTTVYYTMVEGQPVVGKVLVTRKASTTTTTAPVVEATTTTTTTTTAPSATAYPFAMDDFVNAWQWYAGIEYTWKDKYCLYAEYREFHLGELDELTDFYTKGYALGFRYRY